ncbi:Programmed cell death protein 2 [Thelohanellus kitauei]|uniref:Programmed cell death protein 2 n=1 Tax=Thelohanellus kitauei TaxID=669202 RepID=A0A0C2MPA8_THEKT|nr:Programmed cell death protein 2 [Thelohanellus kitauei]
MEYYGILEKYENQFDRLPIFFPSKVGGTPVWLDPSHTPDLNLIKCEGCKKTMTFFLQMYCPLSFPSAYHRTLFLFCCRSEDCCKNSNVTPFVVLRSNLPQVNEYYGDDADLDLTDEQAARYCLNDQV